MVVRKGWFEPEEEDLEELMRGRAAWVKGWLPVAVDVSSELQRFRRLRLAVIKFGAWRILWCCLLGL